MLTRRPVMMLGMADGTIRRVKICIRRAPRETISVSSAESAVRTPLYADMAATTTVIRNARITFDRKPMPNQMTSTGASASFGSAFSTINHGSATCATGRENQNSSPTTDPMTVPSTKPRSVDAPV